MIKDVLNLDDRDIKIITWFNQDPYVSQQEIASRLGLSQPSVNVRINKLKNRGLIKVKIGFDFNKVNLMLAKIDLVAKNAEELLTNLEKCPYFVNGFIVSGQKNVTIFISAENLKKIDDIVNSHLRENPDIQDVSMNIIVSSKKDFIFAIDVTAKNPDCAHIKNCGHCITDNK